MHLGVRIQACFDLPLLQMEWRRLGIETNVVAMQAGDDSLHLSLIDEARAWMPEFDTLDLATTLRLDVSDNEDDLLREIWLTLLNSPLVLEFPSVGELISSVNIRRNIARNAARTCLNFDSYAIERPIDCWRYSDDTGFVLIPGSALIESLKKACHPELDGKMYSFSCYRATEYVILLSIAEEARESHPELLQALQAQWEKQALTSSRFQDVFLQELGSLEQPMPMHYYVPGDRVWFRNPDEASEESVGHEGSWELYLGGGLFANFWKRNRHFKLLEKCVEIYHWRDATYRDEQGELQMDEDKVDELVAKTLETPELCDRVFERMHRFRDAFEIYEQGGCMDATREVPKFVRVPHCDMIQTFANLPTE